MDNNYIFLTALLSNLFFPMLASADPKSDCETAASYMGFPTNEYSFVERGVFAKERHIFGSVICYVNHDGSIDSLYRFEEPIAEDGYYGERALQMQDQILSETTARIDDARKRRDAVISNARDSFNATREQYREEEQLELENLRIANDPFAVIRSDASDDDGSSELGSDVSGDDISVVESATVEEDAEVSTKSEVDQTTQMWVAVNKLTRRTCPSTNCGKVGWLLFRQSVNVFEEDGDWVRITEHYDASCNGGLSEYVDSGNRQCSEENGIVSGRFAEWVSKQFLTTEQPVDPASTATQNERLVSGSDDFQLYRTQFMDAANRLIDQGRCTEEDFLENGGWVKSSSTRSAYFIYCGGFTISNRIYLDVSSGRIFQ